MNRVRADVRQRLSRTLLILIIVLIFVGLASAVLSLPPGAAGLSAEVDTELAQTGVSNRVTATLLNFRAYDTLLEIAILLLAATAIRALRTGDPPIMQPGGDVLTFLSRVLVPLMILIAGYLLWSGTDAPGGAFQAGAILAAASVLLILAGHKWVLREEGLPMRLGLTIGLAAFLVVSVTGLAIADAFLGYSQQSAAKAVLSLEIGASVSIALALLDMFVSVLRGAAMRITDRDGR